MEKIALVSCVKLKQNYSCRAQEMYRSALFHKSKSYAEKFCDRYFILSAKYGLLAPDQVIEPYELTLKTMKKSEKVIWANSVYEKMQKLNLDRSDVKLVWLAGMDYQKELSDLIQFAEQENPLKGMRQGERMQWLKKQVELNS